MKLEGSLDAFGLPDIFQLLSFTKKSGGLHLRNPLVVGVVYVAEGAVTGATSDSSRQGLARRLVGSGVIDDDQLAAAVQRVADSDQPLGFARALLELGFVDADALRRAATEHTVDAVFDLLQWPQGDFSFSVDEANPDDVGVSLSTEQLVTEANGRQESWAAISKVIATGDVVLSMPVRLDDDALVTRDDWALLALVDGRRTVTDLVDVTGWGQYAVASALASLVDRGLLTPRDRRGDHVTAVERQVKLLARIESITAPAEDTTETSATPSLSTRPGSDANADAAPAREETAASDEQVARAEPESSSSRSAEPVADLRAAGPLLGGAHRPGDVVPPRPEPFLPPRQPQHPEQVPAAVGTRLGSLPGGAPAAQPSSSRPMSSAPASSAGGVSTQGSVAMAADPQTASLIERDPSVNRSLLLRLIAGVRGL